MENCFLISGDKFGNVKLWSMFDKKPTMNLKSHPYLCNSICFLGPDLITSCGNAGFKVKICSLSRGEILKTFNLSEDVSSFIRILQAVHTQDSTLLVAITTKDILSYHIESDLGYKLNKRFKFGIYSKSVCLFVAPIRDSIVLLHHLVKNYSPGGRNKENLIMWDALTGKKLQMDVRMGPVQKSSGYGSDFNIYLDAIKLNKEDQVCVALRTYKCEVVFQVYEFTFGNVEKWGVKMICEIETDLISIDSFKMCCLSDEENFVVCLCDNTLAKVGLLSSSKCEILSTDIEKGKVHARPCITDIANFICFTTGVDKKIYLLNKTSLKIDVLENNCYLSCLLPFEIQQNENERLDIVLRDEESFDLTILFRDISVRCFKSLLHKAPFDLDKTNELKFSEIDLDCDVEEFQDVLLHVLFGVKEYTIENHLYFPLYSFFKCLKMKEYMYFLLKLIQKIEHEKVIFDILRVSLLKLKEGAIIPYSSAFIVNLFNVMKEFEDQKATMRILEKIGVSKHFDRFTLSHVEGHRDLLLSKIGQRLSVETWFNENVADVYKSKKYVNLKLKTKDGFTIDVHKELMIFKSNFFFFMFRNPWMESQTTGELEIEFFDGDCLKEIIRYLYTGEVVTKEKDVLQKLGEFSEMYFEEDLARKVYEMDNKSE